jgi:uncharacterized membrane protein (UPF0136 family)
MRVLLTIAVLLGLLGASAGVALWAWQELGDVEMSTHGLVALGLGAGITFALGAGLMTLVFFSSRRGYDARAHQPDDPPPPPDEISPPPGPSGHP